MEQSDGSKRPFKKISQRFRELGGVLQSPLFISLCFMWFSWRKWRKLRLMSVSSAAKGNEKKIQKKKILTLLSSPEFPS
jgi:hypothetical protein